MLESLGLHITKLQQHINQLIINNLQHTLINTKNIQKDCTFDIFKNILNLQTRF